MMRWLRNLLAVSPGHSLSANRQAAAWTLAIALTLLFWLPLWAGGGLVGGDVYSYYLPQKSFYADRLRAGELPLWNNRTGYGYPLIAESQTGAFYPPNLLLYSTLDLNTAYNINHLLHYVLAFVFTWTYARAMGLRTVGALLCALVYVYGWFPPRVCWEWAILTGAWLPAALWCTERFLQSHRWRFALLLTLVLAVQLFAGHFMLAFLTLLVLAVYVPARVWLGGPGLPFRPVIPSARNDKPPETRCRSRLIAVGILAGALALGLALAAVQLLPAWELKQLSQRDAPGEHHDPMRGAIPIAYWSQMVRPWHWYAVTMNRDDMLEDLA
ncbi:MAG: hypothetical protein ACREJB_18000, partial [Planctomycetaceae bacterium]